MKRDIKLISNVLDKNILLLLKYSILFFNNSLMYENHLKELILQKELLITKYHNLKRKK